MRSKRCVSNRCLMDTVILQNSMNALNAGYCKFFHHQTPTHMDKKCKPIYRMFSNPESSSSWKPSSLNDSPWTGVGAIRWHAGSFRSFPALRCSHRASPTSNDRKMNIFGFAVRWDCNETIYNLYLDLEVDTYIFIHIWTGTPNKTCI